MTTTTTYTSNPTVPVDPLVTITGEAYVYAGGNPISFSDPDGLAWFPIIDPDPFDLPPTPDDFGPPTTSASPSTPSTYPNQSVPSAPAATDPGGSAHVLALRPAREGFEFGCGPPSGPPMTQTPGGCGWYENLPGYVDIVSDLVIEAHSRANESGGEWFIDGSNALIRVASSDGVPCQRVDAICHYDTPWLGKTKGMAVGNHIYCGSDCGDLSGGTLILHEYEHVKQQASDGLFFWVRYVYEWQAFGYCDISYEEQAYAAGGRC